MTLSELTEAVAEKTGLPKRHVSSVLRAFAEETKRVVTAGERLVIPGFGTFHLTSTESRELFGNGEMSECGGKIRFHQSRRLSWKS